MAFYDWNYGKGRNHMTFEEFEALEKAEMGVVGSSNTDKNKVVYR